MSTTTTSRKCVEGCRCGRHRKKPLEVRVAIATTLRRRIQNDPSAREHMARIARERWERERAT
jgi:hypothetical protein